MTLVIEQTPLKLIKSEAEYDAALAELDELMILDPPLDTPEGARLEVLSLLLQAYEAEHYPMELPDPVDAILFRMEQQGLRQRDLIPYFGSRSRVSEVLARKRPLTLPMIRALHKGLGIPLDVLCADT